MNLIENVIIDCINEIKEIPSFQKEYEKRKKKLKEEGKSDIDINKLEEKGIITETIERIGDIK